jgi:hypothetical protein
MANVVEPGDHIQKTTMDSLKTAADQALTTVGRSYSWTQHPVVSGGFVEKVDLDDLHNALNVAYDNIKTSAGHLSYDSSDRSDDSDYSYNSDNSINTSLDSVCNHDAIDTHDTPDRFDNTDRLYCDVLG